MKKQLKGFKAVIVGFFTRPPKPKKLKPPINVGKAQVEVTFIDGAVITYNFVGDVRRWFEGELLTTKAEERANNWIHKCETLEVAENQYRPRTQVKHFMIVGIRDFEITEYEDRW